MANGTAGRPRTIERKTSLSIPFGLSGWLEYVSRGNSGGVGAYLAALAEADRARVADERGEEWDRYIMFLSATRRQDEMDKVLAELIHEHD